MKLPYRSKQQDSSGDSTMARIQAKGQLNRWRVIAVAAIVAVLVVSLESAGGLHQSKSAGTVSVRGDYIARVSVLDFVFDDKTLQETLRDVEEDDSAKALIVRIDTPGGSAVGGEEIYYQLREISRKKPVVAVMRSIATSAGYMVAIGTDHIVAREGTITGSIGVLVQSAEISELAKKIGINPILVKSSPLKGSPNLLEKASPEALESLQLLIDSFYHSFVEMVAERRPFNLDRAYELADGRVYSGRQALKYQLVDAIGGESEAVNWLKKHKKIDADLDIIDVDSKPKGLKLLEDIAESMSRKIFTSTTSTLDGLHLIWHPTL